LGLFIHEYFPEAQVSIPMAALVGMSALFAGSSRAILTSIVFAVESTMQESTLLPLIAGCATSYLVSFIMMRTTIMTEKITRRGVQLPESYRPDVLELRIVSDILRKTDDGIVTAAKGDTAQQVLDRIKRSDTDENNTRMILIRDSTSAIGVVDKRRLYKAEDASIEVSLLAEERFYTVYPDNSLDIALEIMLRSRQSILPVVERDTKKLLGIISEWDILKVFEQRFIEDKHIHQHISVKNKALRMIAKRRTKI
jgi:predicted transcriptional regulator